MLKIILCVCGFMPAFLFSQIVNIESKRLSSDSVGFDGNLEGNLEISQNTAFLFSVNTKAQVQYKWKKDLLLLIGDWKFTTGEGQRFRNDGMAHLRYNHKFVDWMRYEIFTQVQYNELLSVQLRYLAGTGPRFKITPWEKYKFYLATLYMFEYEHVGVPDTIHLDHRMSTYLSWTIDPNKDIAFTGTTYYQPLLKNWSDFRIAGMYMFSFRMARQFFFKLEYNFLYDSNPPETVRNFVFNLKTGVQFRFKP